MSSPGSSSMIVSPSRGPPASALVTWGPTGWTTARSPAASEALAALVPSGRILVSESDIIEGKPRKPRVNGHALGVCLEIRGGESWGDGLLAAAKPHQLGGLCPRTGGDVRSHLPSKRRRSAGDQSSNSVRRRGTTPAHLLRLSYGYGTSHAATRDAAELTTRTHHVRVRGRWAGLTRP